MSTTLQLEFCSASNNSSRGYYVFIFQARLEIVFYIYTGATHHMMSNLVAFVSSSLYQGKSVVFIGDDTPLSILDIGTISLSSRSGNIPHLNDAMLLPKVSLSKDLIGWTTFWWSPKLCHLYSDFFCVVKDLKWKLFEKISHWMGTFFPLIFCLDFYIHYIHWIWYFTFFVWMGGNSWNKLFRQHGF